MDVSKQSQTVALEAAAWLIGNQELLGIFLGSTGLSVEALRAGLDTPEIQLAVVEFLLMDDAWVLGFCEASNQPPEALIRTRDALPGGAPVHWT